MKQFIADMINTGKDFRQESVFIIDMVNADNTSDRDMDEDTLLCNIHGVYYDCNLGEMFSEVNIVTPKHILNIFTRFEDTVEDTFIITASSAICPRYTGWNYSSNLVRPSKCNDTDKMMWYKQSDRYRYAMNNINCELQYKPYITDFKCIYCY